MVFECSLSQSPAHGFLLIIRTRFISGASHAMGWPVILRAQRLAIRAEKLTQRARAPDFWQNAARASTPD
jgi:hypothetical protein